MSERKNEDEYFHRRDAEAIAKLRAELQAQGMAEGAASLRAAHAGHCGRCGGDLVVKPFRGIEIDECASCGAVLLDPGELQQIAPNDQASFVSNFLGAFGLRK